MSDQLMTSGIAGAAGLEMTETNDAHHTIVIDDEQPNSDGIVKIGNQQPSTVQLDPLDDNVLEENSIGDIEDLDRKISQSEGCYCSIISTIYYLLSFYAIMEAAILSAVFSSQQSDCRNSRGPLALSAIVSGGVILALLREYFEQFRLLRRGRLLIEKRNALREGIKLRSISRSSTSGISVSDAKEDDLDNLGINSNYWRWIAERVVFVVTLVVFSICLWRSCKSRLSCQYRDLPSPST
jgi:hypothetical protein